MRLGILGGAFNPPHLGHLVLAREAHSQLGLDAVVFMPYAQPPHRELEADPGPEVRLELCRLAVADDECLGVSRVEVDRAGPSYTVETLRDLRAAGRDDDLVVLLGGDQAASLPGWRDPEKVLKLATVAVAERDGWPRSRVAWKLRGLAGSEGVEYFTMPRIGVSSTMVRRRVVEGQPIRYLVPDRVAEYIGEHALYATSAPVGAE